MTKRPAPLWNVRRQGRAEVLFGLTTDQVRLRLYRGQLDGEDWAQTDYDQTWRQVAVLDAFAGIVSGGRRRRLHRPLPDEGLDMTPMIDMTFLLLIFFMITASFHLQKGLDFPPSQTADSAAAAQSVPGLAQFTNRVVVEIGPDDAFYLKDVQRPGRGPAIAREQLAAQLQAESVQKHENVLMILPHELSSHEAVVAVIDAAAQAGIAQVSIADITTRPLEFRGPGRIKRP